MESDEPRETLYDFLYIDNDRVKSLYSQLFSGLISAIENVASKSTAKSTDIKAGIPQIASGTRRSETRVSESRLDKIDPHDLILQDVLQGLADRDIIHKNPSQAQPGNIVLLDGHLTILNFETIRYLIDILPHFLFPAALTETKTQKKQLKSLAKEEKQKIDAALKTLTGIVPWGLQVILEADNITAWGALQVKNLRELPGNITLKVGPTLPGIWYMLGIVDVKGAIDAFPPNKLPDLVKVLVDTCDTVRNQFGRPDYQMGLTPLLIFRRIIS